MTTIYKLKELYLDYTNCNYNTAILGGNILYKKLHYYNSAKQFCLDCAILTKEEIKLMEFDINRYNCINTIK